jgi:hypothetical protein
MTKWQKFWFTVAIALLAILATSYVSIGHAATPATPAVTGQNLQLTWVAPTKNADGTALTNLAGFKLYHRLVSATVFDAPVTLSVMAAAYVFPEGPGQHVYALSAFNSSGQESALSPAFVMARASVTVTVIPKIPKAPTLTVKP